MCGRIPIWRSFNRIWLEFRAHYCGAPERYRELVESFGNVLARMVVDGVADSKSDVVL